MCYFLKMRKHHQLIRLINRVECEFITEVKTHKDFMRVNRRYTKLLSFYNKHFFYFNTKEIDDGFERLNQAFGYANKVSVDNSIREYIKEIMWGIAEIPDANLRYDIYHKNIRNKDVNFSVYPDGTKMIDLLTNEEIIEISILLSEKIENNR